MGSSKSARALEAMRNRARKIIGSKHESAQEALLISLLQEIDIRGCNAALTELFAANVAAPRLMMTLLQCQPILFGLLADLNNPSSWRELSSRFYRIQETIIAQSEASTSPIDMDDNAPSDNTPSDPPVEGDSVINNPDNAPLIEWLRNHPELRLFNIFRGVAINANCQLIGLDEESDRISIELNNELGRTLTAAPDAKSTTVIANDDNTIGFPLHLIDHTPGRAIFALHAPIPVYLDQRDGIDVHIQDLVHVDIHRGIYRFPSGTLIDFSATGFGLVAPKDDRMTIALDNILEFRFQIGMAKVISEGKVCGLTDQDEQIILGVKLANNRATQSLLQREVFRVQREIIIALNEQGIPEELAKHIR